MTKQDGFETPQVGRKVLRTETRKLGRELVLQLLDRALLRVPDSELPALVSGILHPTELANENSVNQSLSEAVEAFRGATLRGEYYEQFDVNWKNSNDLSSGTENWIAEFHYLLDRVEREAHDNDSSEVAHAMEVLFELVRLMDDADDTYLFYADEGGSWLLGIEWKRAFPLYARALAARSSAVEYKEKTDRVLTDLIDLEADNVRCQALARKLAPTAK